MNNKMAINTYQSIIESKKQTRTGTESWIWRWFDGCQMGGGFGQWMKRGGYKVVQIGSYRITMGM